MTTSVQPPLAIQSLGFARIGYVIHIDLLTPLSEELTVENEGQKGPLLITE